MSNNKSNKPVYSGNSIMVRPDGPLICKGDSDITLLNAGGELIIKDKEFALCRCGLSRNKPYCDGTHKTADSRLTQSFIDKCEEDINGIVAALTITVRPHSMYSIQGPVTIFSRDGLSKTTRTKSALCRCGHSANKPFCDGAHNKYDFTE